MPALRSIKLRALAALAASLLIGCLTDISGPKSGVGQIALAPVFLREATSSVVTFDELRVHLVHAGGGATVVDTSIAIAAGDTTIGVQLRVPVGVPLELTLAFVDPVGDTVYRAGPHPFTATLEPQVLNPVVRYSGVGSNAVGVRFVTAPAAAHFQETVAIVAEAFDAEGEAISGTPIIYELANPSDVARAQIPDATVGQLVAGETRGPVELRARLLSGQTATHTLVIQPLASALVGVAGNNQLAPVGEPLAQAIAARVLGADNLPVQGTIVTFGVSAGRLDQSADTSDAAGDVTVLWTLGEIAGPHTLTASIAGVADATVAFVATAEPAAASILEFTSQPISTIAGVPVGVVVTARDSMGNVATQFNSTVSLALTSGAGTAGAHLLGTPTTSAVAGIATFAGVVVDSAGTGYTLTASTAGVPHVVSSAFTISAGAARQLRFTQPPNATQAGLSFAPSIRVAVQDSIGNTVPTSGTVVSLAITDGTGAEGALLLGTVSNSAESGVATFADLNIRRTGAAYTLTATSTGLTSAVSSTFTIAPAAAATIAVNDGDAQSVQVATTVSTAPSVIVTDAFDNPVPGVEVTFVIGTGGGGAANTTQVTDANGVARVGSWTLGTLVGTNTLTANAAFSGTPVTFSANGIAGPPALFAMAAGDGQAAEVDTEVDVNPGVRLTDAHGNPLEGVTVTFAVVGGGGAATGTSQMTDATGLVTLAGSWTLGPTPTINALQVSAGAAVDTVVATATWNRRVSSLLSTGCSIGAGGTVFCWGDNSALGEYGVSPFTLPPSPTPVAVPVPSLVSLADGMGRHNCGITSTQSAVCWGRGSLGELGGGVSGGPAAVTVVGGITWSQVSVSVITSCGVSTSGAAYCWGHNQRGEVGNAGIALGTPSSSPQAVDGGLTFTRIAAGWLHACGITTSGDAYCWGDNTNGRLGIGSPDLQRRSPALVAGGLRFVEIAAGSAHSCGITVSKQAYCWGFNGTGQLGDGTTQSRDVPTPVAGGLRFTNVAVTTSSSGTSSGVQLGEGHSCALTEAGEAFCWGNNALGQLGDGTTTMRVLPTPVSGGLRFSGVAVGTSSACGMRGEAIWCWGWNNAGQLGDGTSLNVTSPTPVAGGITFSVLEGAFSHNCGLATSGDAYCWGSGPLGDGSNALQTSPALVVGGHTFQFITAGTQTSCGIRTDRAAYCWGASIGNDAFPAGSAVPALVSGGLSWSAISAGTNHVCGITAAGQAYCWGANNSGQLGDGTTSTRTTPTLAAGGLLFQAISAGSNYTCGIVTGGLAYCWGANTQGQLGVGNTQQQLVPTPVALTVTGATLVFQSIGASAGQSHTCGVTTLGTGYCWGFNGAGQLGDGTTTNRNIPTAVTGGITFAQIGTGAVHSCGTTPTGAVYCWGSNSAGQLGDGTLIGRQSPTQVIGGLTFTGGSVGGAHTCGISGGAAYCGGSNSEGQLGTGAQPSLPVRVVGF